MADEHKCEDACCSGHHAAAAAEEMEEEFMGDNKEEQEQVGVDLKLTPDGGVMKKIITLGSGPKPPHGADVNVHYTGRLEDGTVFDSSRERGTPFSFKLGEGQVIKGWDQGVATMRKGEQAYLTCKPEYAYGDRAQGKIPSNSTLIFEVELLSFTDEKDLSPAHDQGILKKVVKEGTGYEMPTDLSTVQIAFTAALKSNGQVFDQAGEDKPFSFTIGDEEVCLGLDKGVESMKQGEKAVITVAPQYAFGEKGDEKRGIPSHAEILYTVTLLSFTKPKMAYQMEAAELISSAEKRRIEGNGFYTKGRVSLAKKRYEAAITLLDADYKMNETEKQQAKKAKVPCLLNLAACMLGMKDYKGCVEKSSKALEVESENVKGLVRRAKALLAMDEWDDAERDLKKALELDAGNVDAQREMAALRRKVAEINAKQKKTFAGMFGKLSKMEEMEEEQKKKQQQQEAAPAVASPTTTAPVAEAPAAATEEPKSN